MTLASLISNCLVTPSLGTRPASAVPSVARAWSPQMSPTRMGSCTAKVSGCANFLEACFPKGLREGKLCRGNCATLRSLPTSARSKATQLGSLGSWKEAKPPKGDGVATDPVLGFPTASLQDAHGFRTTGTQKGDEGVQHPALGLDK